MSTVRRTLPVSKSNLHPNRENVINRVRNSENASGVITKPCHPTLGLMTSREGGHIQHSYSCAIGPWLLNGKPYTPKDFYVCTETQTKRVLRIVRQSQPQL
jgi:hypothetical protein